MEARWLLPAPGHILQCSNARRKSGLQKSSGWLTILEPITVTLGDQVWVICPVQSPKAVSDLLVVWVEAEVKVKGCCDFEWGGQGRPRREGGTWAETWGRGEWLLGFAPEQLEGVRITFYWGGKAVKEQVWCGVKKFEASRESEDCPGQHPLGPVLLGSLKGGNLSHSHLIFPCLSLHIL